jgi:YVTN family beta-propeller protein
VGCSSAGPIHISPGPTPGTIIAAICVQGNVVKEFVVARFSGGISIAPVPESGQLPTDCKYVDNMQDVFSSLLQSIPASLGNAPAKSQSEREAPALANLLPSILNLPFPPTGPVNSAPPTPACDPNSSLFEVNHYEDTVTRVNVCPLSTAAVISVASKPLQVALTPDGSTAVVSSYDSAINFIDTATNKSAMLNLSTSLHPCGVAITPDGKSAYVTNLYDIGASILVVDLASRSLVKTIPVDNFYPENITITPDGSQAWVTYYQANIVTVIDTLTNTVAATLSVPQALGIAFDPAGTTAYVTSSVTPGQLYLFDTSTFKTTATIPVGNGPVDVATSPDGGLVFVINYQGGTSIIDSFTNKVIGTLPSDPGSRGITFIR